MGTLMPFPDTQAQTLGVSNIIRSTLLKITVTAASESIVPDMEAVLKLQTTDQDISMMLT